MITRRQVATLLWRALRKVDPTFAEALRSEWRQRDLQGEADELIRKAIARMDAVNASGLTGLNLVAQNMQAQLDKQKAADDQAIADAEQNLDAAASQQRARINVYGIPTENASAIGNAEAWAKRKPGLVVLGDDVALNATMDRIAGKLRALSGVKRGRIGRLLSMLEHLSRRPPRN